MKIIYDDYPLAGLLFVLKLFLLTIYLLVIKLCNIHLIEPKSWVSFFLNWGHTHFHYLKQKYQSTGTSIFVTRRTNNTVTRMVYQCLVGNLYLPRGYYFLDHNTIFFYQSLISSSWHHCPSTWIQFPIQVTMFLARNVIQYPLGKPATTPHDDLKVETLIVTNA